MIWIITLTIALALFALAVTAVSLEIKRGSWENRFFSPLRTLLAGVYLAVFVLLLPIFYQNCRESGVSVLLTILTTLQGTLKVFSVDAEAFDILSGIPQTPGLLSSVYSVTVSVFLVLAPLSGFGFLISLFLDVSAHVKYLFCSHAEQYIFSCLNERSICLARDLRSKHPKAVLLFAACSDADGENSDALRADAREINGLCFTKDVLSVRLRRIKDKKKKVSIFLMDEDQTVNVQNALMLREKYGHYGSVELFVFASGTEGEIVLSQSAETAAAPQTGAGDPCMRVRRIDLVRSSVYRMLYEEGKTLLFDTAGAPDEEGVRTIHAVLVGLGRYGTEMLKALSWYCQMDGYRLVIDGFDRDPNAKDRLAALAPDLLSEEYNGRSVPGEACYTIRIHAGAEVGGAAFEDALSQMRDTTFVFVALGSDEDSLNTADRLGVLYARMRVAPRVRAVIMSTEKAEVLRSGKSPADKKNASLPACGFDTVGDTASLCTEEIILKSDIEQQALKRHLNWGSEAEFWLNEYNYRSSVASVIHRRARKDCGIPGSGKPGEEWTPEEKEGISCLEHRRWNAYMRSEGYIYSGSKDPASRNKPGKTHHNLVPFSELTDEDKEKDAQNASE